MNRALLRKFPLYINPSASKLISSLGRLGWYSSKADSSSETDELETYKPSGSINDFDTSNSDEDIQPISNQELKKQIEKFYKDGDEEILPSIFEAILRRKLAGIKDEEDAELMKELDVDHPLDNTRLEEAIDLETDEDDAD